MNSNSPKSDNRSFDYVVADAHLGHKLVAGTRGFFTASGEVDIEAHDEAVLDSIRQNVESGSHLILLGDNSHDKDYRYALRLLGDVKRELDLMLELIPGNHDPAHPLFGRTSVDVQREFYDVFDLIFERRSEKTSFSRKFYISHFPILGDRYDARNGDDRFSEWRFPAALLESDQNWSIHGHTHQQTMAVAERPNHLCVSWDVKRRPVSYEELRKSAQGQMRRNFLDQPVAHWGEQEQYRELARGAASHEFPLVGANDPAADERVSVRKR